MVKKLGTFSRTVPQQFPALEQWRHYPALSTLICLVIGIVAASRCTLPAIFLHERLYPIFTLSAIVSIIYGLLTQKKTIRFVLAGIAGFLLFWHQAAGIIRFEDACSATDGALMRVTGTIISPQVPYFGRISSIMKIDYIEGCRRRSVAGTHVLCLSDAVLPDSCQVTVMARRVETASVMHAYGFDEKRYLMSQGFSGRLEIDELVGTGRPTGRIFGFRRLRNYVLSVVKRYPDPDVRAVVRAAFTGERNYISPKIREAFTGAGLVHILALSGFHAGILMAAVYALMFFFPFKKGVRHGTALTVLWGYLFFVGPIPSLVRAVIMTTVVILTIILQKKPYSLQTLCLAAVVWLLFSPASLFQPGFQLSYAATFGIITFFPRLLQALPGVGNRYLDYGIRSVWSSLSVSIAAFTATVPIMLYHFGAVSFYGIVATLLAVPLMTMGMWLFFVAMLVPPLSGPSIAVSSVMIHLLIALANQTSALLFASIKIPALHYEGTIAIYCALLAVVTVRKKAFLKTLVWSGAVLAILLPSDIFIHRMVTPPMLVVGMENRSTPFVLMQWHTGDACYFCRCSPSAFRRAVRSAGRWTHHYPEMTLRHWCGCDGKVAVDSSRTGAMCSQTVLHGNDSLTFSASGGANADFICRYLPETGTFTAAYRKERVTLTLDSSGIAVATSTPHTGSSDMPCTIMFGKRGIRIRNDEQ